MSVRRVFYNIFKFSVVLRFVYGQYSIYLYKYFIPLVVAIVSTISELKNLIWSLKQTKLIKKSQQEILSRIITQVSYINRYNFSRTLLRQELTLLTWDRTSLTWDLTLHRRHQTLITWDIGYFKRLFLIHKQLEIHL